MESLGILFGILLVLAILAVVGHVLWIIGAALLRLIFDGSPAPQSISLPHSHTPHPYTPPPRAPSSCPGCGAPINRNDIYCSACGYALSGLALGEQYEYAATASLLQRWQQAGRLDSATYSKLTQLLEEERVRLAGQASAPDASPAATTSADAPQLAEPTLAEPLTAYQPAARQTVELPSAAPRPPAAPPIVQAPTPPPAPAAPRRTFTEMLATFMEESSIRWGELIGGLLIIGCSLALVISLWSEIAERPFLQFSVFMGLTAGLFGLGFYSAHKWKLPTTSRGVLLTATTLVPLNFLAVTAFGRSTAASLGIVLAEAVAWLVFAGLVWLAAREVALEQQRWLTVGTLGASLALLLAKHFAPAGLSWRNWLLLGALPVVVYVLSLGAAIKEAQWQPPEQAERTAYGLFTVLGVNLFAALLPVGLLQLRAGNWGRALHENAPLVALLGLPALAVGWLLWQKLRATEFATERTIAASLGLCGAGLLLGSTVLAFPLVKALVAIALLNVALWGWAAWRYELRPLRWLALSQAVWAFQLLALLALGRLSFGMENSRALLAALLSNTGGLLLLIVFASLSGVAELLRARQRAEQQTVAQDFATAGLLAGVFSLLLLSLHGFGVAGDPKNTAWVFGFYALAALVLAWRRKEILYTWAGLVLLLALSVQTCVYKFGWPLGWQHASIVSVLALAATAASLTLGSLWRGERARALFAQPALLTAWVSAAGASLAMLMRTEGLQAVYLAPLVFVALTCVLYAWRLSSSIAAAAGGVIFNLTVTLAYVIWVKRQGGFIGGLELARLAQLNLLTGALYALGWLRGLRATGVPAWVRWQVRAIAGVSLSLLALAAFRLIVAPATPSLFVQSCGAALGWVTFGLVALSLVSAKTAVAAASAAEASNLPDASAAPNLFARVSPLTLGLLAGGTLLACTVHRFDPVSALNVRPHWLGYHTLLAVLVVTAWLLLWLLMQAGRVETAAPRGWRAWLSALTTPAQTQQATLWAVALGSGAVLLALRGFDAPGGPWRGVVALAAIAGLSIGLALARRNGAYFYAAGALACLALTEWIFGYSRGGGSLLDVALLNVAVLAAVAMLSLALELKVLRPHGAGQTLAFHQFVALLLLALTCLKVAAGLELDFLGAPPLYVKGWTSGLALFAVVSLCVACIWDGWFAYRFWVLYGAGLALLGACVDQQNWQADKLSVSGAIALTVYAFGAAALWRQREAVAQALSQARVPQLDWRGEAGLWWLTKANAVLALGGIVAAGWTVLTVADWRWRVLAASVALLAPLALGWVARGAQRLRPQTLAAALAFAAAVIWSWAWVSHVQPHRFFERLVLLLAWALGGGLIFYALEAARRVEWTRLGDWERATRRLVRGVSLLGAGVLGLVLFVEWVELVTFGAGRLPFWAKSTVTVLLLALTGAQIGFALWPGRDPLNGRAEQRGRYVYAAEICAVLTLAHVRLIAPWLFGGAFKAYWPLLIIALAFVGVGVSDQLRRRGRLVLAEPLARTGLFLPLLPSLGYWLAESRVDYAGLLLLVGLFYGLLSVMRQSFGFGLLAALAANGGWWHWLQRTDDYGFLTHPQVWLIPAALSVMLAAHLNRAQLSQEQITTIRYTALMTIYVSSTADIFISGVGRTPWLPLVLAVLSVAGVMLGMLLRVRAYLFLGTAFLLLAVITMVWHAALSLGWGWLWYVVGIGFGIAILYLFALFERKRATVLGLVEQLKGWQA